MLANSHNIEAATPATSPQSTTDDLLNCYNYLPHNQEKSNQKEKSSHHTWHGTGNNDNSHDIWNQTNDDDSHENWKLRQFGTTKLNNQNGKKFYECNW